jgi:hypothetical protein
LKEALKDVPDDYVVRLDAPTGAVGIPCGNDRVGPLIDECHYRLNERDSEVKSVDIDTEFKEVILNLYISLEESDD